MPIPDELLKLMQGPQFGQKPLGGATTSPLAAPQAAPAGVGPTLANEAALGNPPVSGLQVPPSLDLGVPSILDPKLSTGDFSGTGGGIGEVAAGLKEGSIFRSGGPAPSVLAAQERGEVASRASHALDPSLPTPQASTSSPQATPPAPQPTTPTASAPPQPTYNAGTITRGGETTFFGQGGGQITPGQGEIDKFQAFSDFQSQVNPATRENAALGGPAPLSSVGQANVAAGRPSNVSAANVEVAQREEVQRKADAVQRASQGRIEQGVSDFLSRNRDATPEQQQQQRALLVAQEAETSASQGGGGLSVSDQVSLSAEGRAIRKEEEGTRAVAAEEAKSLSRATAAAKGLASQAENIGDIAKTTQRQVGKAFTTGVSGLIMSLKPGSTAKDMRANLDTLTADAAFTSLQAMRDASPTGGALGQVSERELTLLGAAVRSLDPNLARLSRTHPPRGDLACRRPATARFNLASSRLARSG